ncbi:lipase [Serratia sp. Leaf51]|nr:lipase [Serratia sp. Leaf51]
MINGRLLQTASALAVTLAIQSQAFAFDSLTVFGDSLSDTGNNGRWTWNSSHNKLYDEQLASDYGLTLTPSRSGGSNYAAGGATAVGTLNPQDNTASQVQKWLAQNGGKADSNELYIHWIGGNDLAAAVLMPAQAQAIAGNSAANAAAQVEQLLDAGAGVVVVPTVPDISVTPILLESVITAGLGAAATPALQAAFASLDAAETPTLARRKLVIREAFVAAASVVSNNPLAQQAIATQLMDAYNTAAAQASTLSNYYNAAEEAALAQRGGNIARADINGIFQEILANPGAFGVTNTAGMACPPGMAASECTSSTTGFSSAQDYLFADHFHPSPQIHTIMAQYIQSILAAPVQVTRLNQGIQASVRGSRATLDSRYQQLREGNNPMGAVGVFGGYSGGYQHYDRNDDVSSGHGNTNNLTIGADYQLNENILLGGLVAGSLDNQRPDDSYRYDTRAFQASLFSHLRAGRAWLDGDVHYFSADLSNIQRSIKLGGLTRVEKGETNGKLWGSRLTAGYDFPLVSWLTTGPILQYAWDYSHVDGYSEKDNTSSSMRFGDQNAHSLVGSAGWRLDARTGIINPWAQVNYRNQFGDDVYVANGGLKSTSLTLTRSGETQDKDWVDFSLGADLPLSDSVSMFAAVAQTAGLSDGNQTSYNVGISARF